jgi:AraC-like DNA-binding protein
MKYWYHKPDHILTEYVRTVLVIEGFAEPGSNTLPIFTNGMPTLFCRTEKGQTEYEHIEQLTLFGTFTPSDFWTINEHTTIIAYFFKPFALAALFNTAAKKLKENPIDLCNWSPHKFNALKTQLVYSDDATRKIEVLDNLLIEQLKLNNRACQIIQYATDQIMCNSGTEILPEILKELHLTERTFQRIFKKFVGVTPTQYRRICQFQFSFGQLRSKQFDKISDIAFNNSFADQSHFIRSFKEFTQTTPNDYLRNGLTDKHQ